MAKSSKNSSPSFEQAMNEIESIVEHMESDQLSLEELMNHYERGSKLLQECEHTLQSAKKRLETIRNDDTNASQITPPSNHTPSSTDDDEIRLF